METGLSAKQQCQKGTQKEHEEKWRDKQMHGYLQKTLSGDDTIDMKTTNKWLDLRLSSHAEGYLSAIQEQEFDVEKDENMKKTRKRPAEKEGNGYILQNMSPETRICVPPSMLMPTFGTHTVPQCETQPDCEDIVPRNTKE